MPGMEKRSFGSVLAIVTVLWVMSVQQKRNRRLPLTYPVQTLRVSSAINYKVEHHMKQETALASMSDVSEAAKSWTHQASFVAVPVKLCHILIAIFQLVATFSVSPIAGVS